MKVFYTCLFCCFSFLYSHSQSFTGTGGSIPDDDSTGAFFPVAVSGVGNINGMYGLATVCLNIKHSWDRDIEIRLKSPDGTLVALSLQSGNDGDDYTNTCFSSAAPMIISDATAPFTGTFRPQGIMGAVNNGQNANGTWYLCVRDLYATDTGHVINFTITFNNAPAPPLPTCIADQQAGYTCATATLMCSNTVYCGTTAGQNPDRWPALEAAFCSAIEKNSFLKFTAADTMASFNILATTTFYGRGLQAMVYQGECLANSIVSKLCILDIEPGITTTVSPGGLVPGSTYYLMIDGNGNDACDFMVTPVSGISNYSPPPFVTGPVFYCQGGSAAALSNAVSGENILWYNNPIGGIGSTTAPIPSTAIIGDFRYWVSQTLTCGESTRVPVQVSIVEGARASIANNDTLVCAGSSVAIRFTGTPNTIFTYSINDSTLHTSTFGLEGAIEETYGIHWGTTFRTVDAGLITFPGCRANTPDTFIVAVSPRPSAAISYTDSIACVSSSTILPVTITGQTGGLFSATPAGLHINSSSGEIAPALSTAGNYAVGYTINSTTVCPQSTFNTVVKIASPEQRLWTGAISTAWEDPANWSCGVVPDINSDVVIGHGTIVVSSNITVNSLTVAPGVVVTVSSGYQLIVLH